MIDQSGGPVMEPVSLTCPRCAASWKVIKAGKGPITCPQCKATLDGPAASPAPADPAPQDREQTPPAAPAPPPGPPPLPAIGPVPLPPVADVDDPGLHADYDDRHEPPRRRGMPPLLRVALILLILMILVPLSLFVLFAVVCAVLIAGR